MAEPSTLEPQQSQGEQQPKRRRGRPPRNPQNEEDAAITTTEEKPSESLSKESEQPTVFTQPEQPLALPTHLETDNKQPENETAGQTSEQQTDERPGHGVFIRPGKPTETIVQASDIENNPQQKRDFRPKDSSFGSFFPRSGGRTFAPRSQQEKEQAAQIPQAMPTHPQQPAAPIVLGEPGMEKQQQQGKKNKKNRKQTNRSGQKRHRHRHIISTV